MATLWERTPPRLPPAEPLPLRGDSSDGFQGFFSEFCSEKATSSPVFMREREPSPWRANGFDEGSTVLAALPVRRSRAQE